MEIPAGLGRKIAKLASQWGRERGDPCAEVQQRHPFHHSEQSVVRTTKYEGIPESQVETQDDPEGFGQYEADDELNETLNEGWDDGISDPNDLSSS